MNKNACNTGIENVLTKKLIPYANNAKKHSEDQVKKVASSIKEFGFNAPVLIDKDNGIIAGHCRVMAAELLQLESVPCLRLSHLSDSQKKAYILADNRLSEIGSEWDYEMLAIEVESIEDELLSLTGFERDLLGSSNIDVDSFFEDAESKEKQPKTAKCPKCGEVFEV
jgi:ParB-like chromosome segregation protein Spo0J